jgi:hypothetical protein
LTHRLLQCIFREEIKSKDIFFVVVQGFIAFEAFRRLSEPLFFNFGSLEGEERWQATHRRVLRGQYDSDMRL